LHGARRQPKGKYPGSIGTIKRSIKKSYFVAAFPSSYKGVDIKDFTKSWRDGLAFNALIHKYRPHLFDYNQLINDCNNAEKNLEHAFKLAQSKLNIERLLDVEGS
jgi:hypothetical protein